MRYLGLFLGLAVFLVAAYVISGAEDKPQPGVRPAQSSQPANNPQADAISRMMK